MSDNEAKPQEVKKTTLQIFVEEISASPWTITLLAVITGLIVGGLLVAVTSENVYAAWDESPLMAVQAGFQDAWSMYVALFRGAIGSPTRIIAALQAGDAEEIRRAFNPFLESLVQATPYIFTGLALALGFRAGLFNIGAEGQLFVGAIFAVTAGIYFKGLPPIIHVPVSFLFGALGGALWGFVPGILKAKTGAHEVITTIMMNYIAFRLSEWLLRGPLQAPGSYVPISADIAETAMLPKFFADPIRFHLGFFIALAMAWLVNWFLFKTRWGFDFRSVGANPRAARYAGMSIVLITVLAMSFSGGLAGMAGANEVLGVNHNLAVAFSSGYGFDAIALALLGKSHPLGVVLAALLFGALRSGAVQMQVQAGIPIDIISVIQAFILAFVAAPAIIRTIYRLKTPDIYKGDVFVRGWGGD